MTASKNMIKAGGKIIWWDVEPDTLTPEQCEKLALAVWEEMEGIRRQGELPKCISCGRTIEKEEVRYIMDSYPEKHQCADCCSFL